MLFPEELIACVKIGARKPSLAKKLKNRRYGVAYLIGENTIDFAYFTVENNLPKGSDGNFPVK